MKEQEATYVLKELIRQKELECVVAGEELSMEFKSITEKLKPGNLIKHAVVSELKNNVLNTAIDMTTGFLVRKTIVRSSKNPLLKLLGTFVGRGVGNLIANNSNGLKSIAGKLLTGVFNKEESGKE